MSRSRSNKTLLTWLKAREKRGRAPSTKEGGAARSIFSDALTWVADVSLPEGVRATRLPRACIYNSTLRQYLIELSEDELKLLKSYPKNYITSIEVVSNSKDISVNELDDDENKRKIEELREKVSNDQPAYLVTVTELLQKINYAGSFTSNITLQVVGTQQMCCLSVDHRQFSLSKAGFLIFQPFGRVFSDKLLGQFKFEQSLPVSEETTLEQINQYFDSEINKIITDLKTSANINLALIRDPGQTPKSSEGGGAFANQQYSPSTPPARSRANSSENQQGEETPIPTRSQSNSSEDQQGKETPIPTRSRSNSREDQQGQPTPSPTEAFNRNRMQPKRSAVPAVYTGCQCNIM